MKKLICILAGAALLGACEQKTDVVAPAPGSSPADKKTEHNTTIVNPAQTVTEKTKETTNTTNTNTNTTTASSPSSNSSSSTTTTTTSSPSP